MLSNNTMNDESYKLLYSHAQYFYLAYDAGSPDNTDVWSFSVSIQHNRYLTYRRIGDLLIWPEWGRC